MRRKEEALEEIGSSATLTHSLTPQAGDCQDPLEAAELILKSVKNISQGTRFLGKPGNDARAEELVARIIL